CGGGRSSVDRPPLVDPRLGPGGAGHAGAGGRQAMSRFILNRRRFLAGSAAVGAGLTLSGCDQFDFLAQRGNPVRQALEQANVLTYQTQRLLIGDQTLAREYAASEIRQGMKPNGSTEPTTPEYMFLRAQNFEPYRLTIKGLVEREVSFSLAELRNMPE